MKRFAITMMMVVIAACSFAQSPSDIEVAKLDNGNIMVAGVDALGADVYVLYNSDQVKIYQERTVNDITTFARFDHGAVVDHGTFDKPMVNVDEKSKSLFVEK
ncbi:MAG: hypothetical protein HQ500_00445 [Flavobacteriales bacterium]|nr:hypothetical protein [Flavobacteriales bacterium]